MSDSKMFKAGPPTPRSRVSQHLGAEFLKHKTTVRKNGSQADEQNQQIFQEHSDQIYEAYALRQAQVAEETRIAMDRSDALAMLEGRPITDKKRKSSPPPIPIYDMYPAPSQDPIKRGDTDPVFATQAAAAESNSINSYESQDIISGLPHRNVTSSDGLHYDHLFTPVSTEFANTDKDWMLDVPKAQVKHRHNSIDPYGIGLYGDTRSPGRFNTQAMQQEKVKCTEIEIFEHETPTKVHQYYEDAINILSGDDFDSLILVYGNRCKAAQLLGVEDFNAGNPTHENHTNHRAAGIVGLQDLMPARKSHDDRSKAAHVLGIRDLVPDKPNFKIRRKTLRSPIYDGTPLTTYYNSYNLYRSMPPGSFSEGDEEAVAQPVRPKNKHVHSFSDWQISPGAGIIQAAYHTPSSNDQDLIALPTLAAVTYDPLVPVRSHERSHTRVFGDLIEDPETRAFHLALDKREDDLRKQALALDKREEEIRKQAAEQGNGGNQDLSTKCTYRYVAAGPGPKLENRAIYERAVHEPLNEGGWSCSAQELIDRLPVEYSTPAMHRVSLDKFSSSPRSRSTTAGSGKSSWLSFGSRSSQRISASSIDSTEGKAKHKESFEEFIRAKLSRKE